MTLSYKWLSAYLPVVVDPERLSRILTAIGLEVESMEQYAAVPGGLKGLVIGEVLHTEQHPNADKLKLAKVSIGDAEALQIVCGAPNVAPGQRVVVAPVGATIYPVTGEPMTMKLAKIRGTESQGMICAEDEIGLGSSHAGIMVLPEDATVGMPAAAYFKPYNDTVYEIGLTPNRADAMSHWGVARDVCAYLTHHDRKSYKPILPPITAKDGANEFPVSVTIESAACARYSGVVIAGIKSGPSPEWMQQRLKAIGLRPINNIVDITNYIQHETGQPLHAFDYDRIQDGRLIVKTMPAGTTFTTLDEKERKLDPEDLLICDPAGPLCIAGVYGGLESGVTANTTNIFLESAFFEPVSIRKTSFRHGLRTDAATRFEKGIDISNTLNVLKRAAQLVTEIAGGHIASPFTDVYPKPEPKREVVLKNQYLKKLSGKNYHPETIRTILTALGFTIARESLDAIAIEVPYHKRDVSLPADIVEEILRIDGLDHIEIPKAITITPSVEENGAAAALKEKIANSLVGLGFQEILTNSITNSAYFADVDPGSIVRMINNLSSELDVLRPTMLPTALEVIAFNANRKAGSLRLFEFGKTYTKITGEQDDAAYSEKQWLCIYLTGSVTDQSWKGKPAPADIYYIKGVGELILKLADVQASFEAPAEAKTEAQLVATLRKQVVATIGVAPAPLMERFSLRQPVYILQLDWDAVTDDLLGQSIRFREVPRFPAMERDLALVVPQSLPYASIRQSIGKLKLEKLQSIRLFDVFESEKLGAGKKSMAVNFTFQDESKTLTDKEIEGWMQKIMTTLEKEVGAEIRK